MKAGKKSRQLPSRSGLNQLDKTDRTINDYSKATPLNPTEVGTSTSILNLRGPGKPRNAG